MNTILLRFLRGCALLLLPILGMGELRAAIDPAAELVAGGHDVWRGPFVPGGSIEGVHPSTGTYPIRFLDLTRRAVLLPSEGNIAASGSLALCEGDQVILYVISGSSGTYRSFRWTTGDTTSAIVVTTAGTYGVTVTDASGNSFILTPVTVTVLPRPRVTIVPEGSLSICDGDSVVLDAGPGYAAYSWSNGPTSRRNVVRFGGYYSVTVHGANGCPATSAPVLVKVGTKPNPKVSSTKGFELCEGDTTYLYGYAGYAKYRWSNGDSTQFIRVTGPGDWDDYRLTVTDSNGCSATSEIAPVKFRVKPMPRITGDGPRTFCEGDSITLDAGSIYRSFLWSTGDITRTIVVKESGKFWVMVTDGIDCPGRSDTAVIVVNKRPGAPVTGPLSACQHSMATYTTTKRPGLSYYWTVNGPGASIIGGERTESFAVQWGFAGVGTVRLTVKVDSTGCTSSGVAQVAVGDVLKPAIQTDRSPTLCAGDSVVLDAGPGYKSYKWSNGAQTRKLVVRAAGLYSVAVVNDVGCGGVSDPIMVAIAPDPQPKITTNRPTALCYGDSVELVADDGNTRYDWSTGERTRSIWVKNPGTYTVTVTDKNGCVGASQPVFVVMQSSPVPQVNGPRVVCQNSTSTYDGPQEGGAIYEWKVAGGMLLTPPNQGSATVRWANVGTGTVTITQTMLSTGCSGSTTLVVTIGDSLQPVVVPVGSPVLCAGGSITLDGGPGFRSYAWSTGADSRTITVDKGGAYSVRVVDSNGCAGTSSPFTVVAKPLPVPVITPSGPLMICDGESVVLSAPPGYAYYVWSTGETTPAIEAKRQGDYVVTVDDADGCIGASAPVRLKVNPGPPTPAISFNGDSLWTIPAAGYVWSLDGVTIPDGTSRKIPLAGKGTYTVRVTDEFGCSATSEPYSPYAILGTTVTMPTLEAAAGERIVIPLVLDAPKDLLDAGENRFTAVIRFNASLLKPIGSTPAGVVDGRYRSVTLTGVRPETLTTGALLNLEFLVMLGDSEQTAIEIEDFTWNDVSARAKTVNGIFRLTDLCTDGSVRLLRATGGTHLKPSRPNPATGITEIEYETMESGSTRLYITDPVGRRIATLVDGERPPGHYVVTFDARAIASGLYVYTLETPTERLSRTMIVEH